MDGKALHLLPLKKKKSKCGRGFGNDDGCRAWLLDLPNPFRQGFTFAEIQSRSLMGWLPSLPFPTVTIKRSPSDHEYHQKSCYCTIQTVPRGWIHPVIKWVMIDSVGQHDILLPQLNNGLVLPATCHGLGRGGDD
jgi:hypothetical protein